MRKTSKFILVGGVLAALAVPSVASADVERCQVTTTVTAPSVTKATFTVQEPRGTKDNFDSLWLSKFEVTVTGDTFEGVGRLTADDSTLDTDVPLTIKGTLNADGTISYVAKPADTDNPISWTLDNGKTDATSQLDGTSNPATATWGTAPDQSVGVNFKVTKPVFSTVKGATTTTTTEYKNHGEYVSSLGGGKVAAQACVGMPVVSKQGK